MIGSQSFLLQCYLSARFYRVFGGVATAFVLAWLMGLPLFWPQWVLGVAGLLTLADWIFLFFPAFRFTGTRHLAERLSIGESNPVQLHLQNGYPARLHLEITEELPTQFQARDNSIYHQIEANAGLKLQYSLRPLTRGSYDFGYTVCFLATPLGLVRRRLLLAAAITVKVYPSILEMRRFSLLARGAHNVETGHLQLRKIGHSLEFEQIKEYVQGDDIRQLNWKATARRSNLMANHYVAEKSQQVFAVIDKGRLMKMPFDGLSLLDYAINASLVLGNVSLARQDRFGLLTFSHKPGTFLAAERKSTQLRSLMEALYQEDTTFLESDFEKLYLQVRTQIRQRSLLVLFTNFESISGMKRQLPYLLQLSKHHLLLVVFFENTGLVNLSEAPANDLETIYAKTIAWKFVYEKRMIVKELSQHGIMALLTPPHLLTVNTLNKYLEIKSRHAL